MLFEQKSNKQRFAENITQIMQRVLTSA